MQILSVFIVIVFFVLNIFYTQKIYDSDKIILLVVFAFIIPFVYCISFQKENFFESLIVLLIPFNYLFLLFIIKKSYQKLNKFLIDQKLIKSSLENEVFVYVIWDGDNSMVENIWDKNKNKSPTWLDYILSILLISFPLVLAALLVKFLLGSI